ncbi:MAG: PQQ-binding-like beta-propeller repeat protein [Planctomycetia bacterium]|nr:PQQ-binding-like beta-propeller repeat protein [Planctomycetia bacterium]
MRQLFATLLIALAPDAAFAGESWPQFRGPDGQGHADARGLPLTWSETENVVWKVPVPGRGWSSPVIDRDQIWLTTAFDDGHSLRALCCDRATGKTLFDIEVFRVAEPQKINAKNSYASPTPVIEGNRLWVHFGTYGTACIDGTTGKILWTNQELRLDHKEGPGSSPVLCGDLLVLTCDGQDVQFLAALDKRTGRKVWKTARSGAKNPDPDLCKAYSTPLVISVAGRRQIVGTGADRGYGYDAATGEELWHVDYQGFSNVPCPVFADGLVFIDTGYMKPQLWAIRPDGRGDVTDSHVQWRATAQVPANPSPIVIGEELYMVSDQGVLTCLDARTGREHYKSRLGGNYSASPIAAEGRIYFTSEAGETVVVAAGKKFRELARNQLDGRTLASAAVAGRAIFLRTEAHLYRIESAARRADDAAQ